MQACDWLILPFCSQVPKHGFCRCIHHYWVSQKGYDVLCQVERIQHLCPWWEILNCLKKYISALLWEFLYTYLLLCFQSMSIHNIHDCHQGSHQANPPAGEPVAKMTDSLHAKQAWNYFITGKVQNYLKITFKTSFVVYHSPGIFCSSTFFG